MYVLVIFGSKCDSPGLSTGCVTVDLCNGTLMFYFLISFVRIEFLRPFFFVRQWGLLTITLIVVGKEVVMILKLFSLETKV